MIQVLRYTEELEKVGFTTEQAKVSVQLWMDLMDQNFATKADFKEHYFMTKSDLKEVQSEMNALKSELKNDMFELQSKLKTEMNELRTDVKTEINELRTELKDDIKDLRTEMKSLEHNLTIRLGIMMAASIGILSTILNLKHQKQKAPLNIATKRG